MKMTLNKNNAEKNENINDNGVGAVNKQADDVANDNGGIQNKQDDASNDDGNSGYDASNGSNGEKTFTQDEVNRMMTREKKQGRNSVYNELGIDPNDSDSIELVKSIVSAKKQNAAGANDDGAASKVDDEKFAELERRAQLAEAKAEAMMLGVKPQFADDVVTLASAHLAEQGEGAEFKTVIGELKSKYPSWFGIVDDESNTAGKSGTGSSINPDSGSNGSKKNDGIGKRLAAQRKPSRNGKNFSYWGRNN